MPQLSNYPNVYEIAGWLEGKTIDRASAEDGWLTLFVDDKMITITSEMNVYPLDFRVYPGD